MFHRRIWGSLAGLVAVALVGTVVVQPALRLRNQSSQKESSGLAALANFPGALQIRDSNVNTRIEMLRAATPMIVRRTELSVIVKDFDKSRSEMEEILKRHGGYLSDLMMNANPGSGRYLEATLRVPADQRETAITELKVLGRVESESQSGEDVTQQSSDLDARLVNARNSERRLTDLLRERTGKLADVLAVEKETTRVRTDIERMEAEGKGLTNRVEFTSLVVKLFEVYNVGFQTADSFLIRLRNAGVEGCKAVVEGATSAILFLLAYGPSVLFWSAILFFPMRLAWRRLRRRLLHSL